jgi:hypothetical protein
MVNMVVLLEVVLYVDLGMFVNRALMRPLRPGRPCGDDPAGACGR